MIEAPLTKARRIQPDGPKCQLSGNELDVRTWRMSASRGATEVVAAQWLKRVAERTLRFARCGTPSPFEVPVVLYNLPQLRSDRCVV